MRFGILHISDLHRDLKKEIDNLVLLESLQADFQQFGMQKPEIPIPKLCVVTGDLVYGVDRTAANPGDELERQYSQALEFLVGVADRFFGGRRDKVVLLPGNHDVSYPDVQNSLTRIDIPAATEDKRRLVRELFEDNTLLRWSWTDLCFYRISDAARYRARLGFFAKAYETFYQGTRQFSLEPSEQWAVFDFDDVDLSVIALNSCHRNDPFGREAAFHPSALIQACTAARSPSRTGWLLTAAWHHSLLGMPLQNDYLDAEVLQNLIEAGVSLGLHGHQHRSDTLDERYRIGPSKQKISIISAGTLCAGPKLLPAAVPRSYNVVEVDTNQWKGRVHQRAMVNRLYELPIWGPGRFLESGRSYLEFRLSKPRATRPPQLDEQLRLEKAEALLGAKRWEDALQMLDTIPGSDRARPLRVIALANLGNHALTVSLLWPPQTAVEIVLVGGALLEVGPQATIAVFLGLEMVSASTDASVRDIVRRLMRI